MPTRVDGVDILSLPLGPLEGFVLSRVDGQCSLEDIAVMCGVPQPQTRAILDRLAELGAITVPWARPEPPPRASAAPRIEVASGPSDAKDLSLLERLYGDGAQPPVFHASELHAEAQLDDKARRRIVYAYYLTQDRTLYELLGVAQDVDKAVLRSAYFELSKAFHPDAYFGRDLGPYRTKTEAVFQRLTEAYETLSRKKRRAEYDAYLGATRRIQRAEKMASGIEAESQADAPLEKDLRTVDTAPSVEIRERKSLDERRAVTADRVRKRFASLHTMNATRNSSASGVPERATRPSDPGLERDSALEGLRRALKGSSSRAPIQLVSLVEDAQVAEKAGDLATAMKCLTHVLLLEPSHKAALEVHARIAPAHEQQLLADHIAQASYEESHGKWRAAAKSWMFVADRVPSDARACRQAALALLHSGEDLHKAGTYAESAVRLQGRDIENLTVLAKVYLAAGLHLNARRELEKAVKLDPRNELLKKLLAECKS